RAHRERAGRQTRSGIDADGVMTWRGVPFIVRNRQGGGTEARTRRALPLSNHWRYEFGSFLVVRAHSMYSAPTRIVPREPTMTPTKRGSMTNLFRSRV